MSQQGDAKVDRSDQRAPRRRVVTALRPGDAFVFGCETAGLPTDVLDTFPAQHRLRLPMRPGQRSLNLSNAVAVTVFEAWRQNGFAPLGAPPPAGFVR